METKTTAAKFWVGLIYALLTTASLFALPGWWGKGVAIGCSLVGAAGVYLTTNKPIPPEVHNGG